MAKSSANFHIASSLGSCRLCLIAVAVALRGTSTEALTAAGLRTNNHHQISFTGNHHGPIRGLETLQIKSPIKQTLTPLSSTPNADISYWHDYPQKNRAAGEKTFSKEQEEKILKEYQVPSVKDVLTFAVPAIGVWLCVPLLSMIDTSTVGLIAGTAQQAALNPAIAVINYSSKLMSFLFSGTTTMIAAAQDKDRHSTNNDPSFPKTQTAKTLVGAIQISLWVGVGLGAIVLLFARQLLAAIIGSGGAADPAVMGSAMKYVQIRALGMPAAAMLGSVQTGLLAQRDIKSPLYVTGIAAATNLIMDMLLIRNPHAWVGGAAGAAWATTFSQYIAVGWVMRWLMSSKRGTRTNNSVAENNPDSTPKKGFTNVNTKGFLSGRMRKLDFLKLPSRDISKGFAPFVIPVITTQAGRCSASVTIDHVVSSSLSTASMAANQILTAIYYGLVPVAESLSLAAQSYVPGIIGRDNGDSSPAEQHFAMKHLLKSFLKAAGLCGLFLAAVMGTLPLYSGVFTTDATVHGIVASVVPLLFVTCLKHGVFCASEGILLGQKDLKFLGRQYAFYTFLIPYILLQIKKAALGGSKTVGLMSVWQVFLVYDLFRTALMSARIIWLEKMRMGSAKKDVP